MMEAGASYKNWCIHCERVSHNHVGQCDHCGLGKLEPCDHKKKGSRWRRWFTSKCNCRQLYCPSCGCKQVSRQFENCPSCNYHLWGS